VTRLFGVTAPDNPPCAGKRGQGEEEEEGEGKGEEEEKKKLEEGFIKNDLI
jgi:hypothetical protein